jgi:hypothetical protein
MKQSPSNFLAAMERATSVIVVQGLCNIGVLGTKSNLKNCHTSCTCTVGGVGYSKSYLTLTGPAYPGVILGRILGKGPLQEFGKALQRYPRAEGCDPEKRSGKYGMAMRPGRTFFRRYQCFVVMVVVMPLPPKYQRLRDPFTW